MASLNNPMLQTPVVFQERKTHGSNSQLPSAPADSRFYNEGYAAGHAHGKLHGLFEGRQLGLEKAWEIWEEVGFYEGFAAVAERKLATSGGSGRKDAK